MDETRRFRIPLKPVLALLVAAAVAANLPAAWFTEATAEDRRAEVFSAFVNLSAAPGEGAFAFLGTVADLSGQEARVRRDRRDHVLPGLLEAYAGQIDMQADWLRGAVLDPDYAHPFDISAFEVTGPEFDGHGKEGPWHWGLATSGAQDLSPEDAPFGWCARWLVVWDAADWFYAPVGTVALNEMLAEAVPELRDVTRALSGGCDG